MTSGEATFFAALESGLTQDALWGGLTPMTGLMIALFIFSFAYYIFRKLFKGGRRGKANV